AWLAIIYRRKLAGEPQALPDLASAAAFERVNVAIGAITAVVGLVGFAWIVSGFRVPLLGSTWTVLVVAAGMALVPAAQVRALRSVPWGLDVLVPSLTLLAVNLMVAAATM